MNLAAGQVIGGDFELLRPLGEGGMGVVWLAIERPLNRQVALKVMRPSESPAREGRFGREARALASLNHPSIISVLRTGVDAETGLHFIATPAILLTPDEIRRLCDETLRCPYPAWLCSRGSGTVSRSRSSDSSEPSVSGVPLTLADLLDGGKALPEAAVARIARDLASALAAAHAAGILHRDVKPSNILFDADGRAMLADFGLAKFTDATAATGGAGGSGESPVPCDTLSLDGAGNPKFIGSPSYAAPEAFRNGAAAATPALDWYSLGAVLYEALTGDRPRSLRTPSSYDPKHISRSWDRLLAALLEPDPARCLADGAAVLRALDAIARHPAARRRSRRTAWLFFAAAAVAIAVAVLFAGRTRPPEPPAVAAASAVSSVARQPESSAAPVASAGGGVAVPPDAATAPRGVLGVVQSAAFPNPVKDFSRRRADAAAWFGLSPPPAAGERKTLSLGAASNRITLVWCPPHPTVALQGFWILEAAVDTALACEIHNNFPSSPGFEVWKKEPLHSSREAQFGFSVAKDMLGKLDALAGFGDGAHFDFPTSMQMDYARRVLPPGAADIPLEEPWSAEYAAAFAGSPSADMGFMPLQPVLLPGTGF